MILRVDFITESLKNPKLTYHLSKYLCLMMKRCNWDWVIAAESLSFDLMLGIKMSYIVIISKNKSILVD